MASVNGDLIDSVERFRRAEKELVESRIQLATMFSIASSTQPVSGLARLTGINRTTIYWLINNWSKGENISS